MAYRSNSSDVAGSLEELASTFGMQRQSEGRRMLGDEIADIAAARIYERTRLHKLGPDGEPLKPLKRSTILRKLRKGFPPVLGIETGEMLDKAEIRGDVVITVDTVTMTYGLDPWPEQKAEWFQEGREGVQAPRFFYDLGRDGEEAVEDYIDEVAEASVQDFHS